MMDFNYLHEKAKFSEKIMYVARELSLVNKSDI